MQGAKAYFTLEGDHVGRSEAVKSGWRDDSGRGIFGEGRLDGHSILDLDLGSK